MQFQEETELTIPSKVFIFKEFYGRIIDNMPLLLSGKDKEGNIIDVPRKPITPKRLMHVRVHGENENDRQSLRKNYVHTAYPIINDPNNTGESVIASYSEPIVKEIVDSLNPKSKIRNYSLDINGDIYQAIRSCGTKLIIPASVANNLRSDGYSEPKTRREAWEFVAEGDVRLVDDTLKMVVAEKGGSFNNRMGWFFSKYTGLRLLGVGSVGSNSSADAYVSFLDGDNGRLVGECAGGANARESIDTTVTRTESDIIVPKPKEIMEGVYAHIQGISATERVTKKGLLEAIKAYYK